LRIVGPLSKMKPCTRRVPKIGKKTLESCIVQNFDNQVKAVVDAHTVLEGIQKQMANNSWTIPIRIGSMITVH
jgi:hypothetical protein